jgi:predicted glycosyltransferase
VRAAWERLRAEDATGGRRLVVFPGPFAEEPGFTTVFGAWLRACDLSISRAGYNTCADVLAARARAMVVPSPLMSDQRLRARRLAEMGVVETVAPEDASPETLAAAIRHALTRPRPIHAIRLDGAERTRAMVEQGFR